MEPARCEVGMCEKCVELDAKIDRYKQMARMIADQRTLDVIAKIIEEANAEKAARWIGGRKPMTLLAPFGRGWSS
jgi:hypothetical protein